MKFCKSLQDLIGIADPSWIAYWINYKVLKKVIKALPMMETAEDASLQERHLFSAVFGSDSLKERKQQSPSTPTPADGNNKLCLGRSPREVFFFKLLYCEFKKVSEFFDQTLAELSAREARIRHDLAMSSERNHAAVTTEQWAAMAKNIYSLYKDLLLLETYAIMSYCGFSKILKKKDKCTGLPTRASFMEHFVEKASFSNYPSLLGMIRRCQFEYDDVSRQMSGPLLEDQRLFLSMILKMNVDAAGVAVQEGGRHSVPLEGPGSQPILDDDDEDDDDDDEEEAEEGDDLFIGNDDFGHDMRPAKRMKL